MSEFREKDMVKVAALVAQLQDELGRKEDLLAVGVSGRVSATTPSRTAR